MSIIDLFSGPGGWSSGLNLIGRAETVGIEWDKAACDTARAAGHDRLQADIAELSPSDHGADVEGLIASPPCQGFSMAGKGKGREDSALIIAATGDLASGRDPRDTLRSQVKDDRSLLALEPLRWALELEPEWTAWEQVPAVLPLWEACAEVLRADGYSVWTGLVQAEQYGVPQTRRRAILTASRQGEVVRPVPTHSKFYPRTPGKLDDGVQKWVSMAEALGADGPWLCRSSKMANSARRDLTHPAPTIAFGHDSASAGWIYVNGNQANSARRSEDQPAPTVHFGERMNLVTWEMASAGATARYSAGQVPRGTHLPSATITGKGTAYWTPANFDGEHSAKTSVRVSVEEAAALQSFPVDYPWQGSRTAQYRQVGDAVPPVMAAHVLASIGVGELSTEVAERVEVSGSDWSMQSNQGNPRDGYHRRDAEHPSQTVTAQCLSWNWVQTSVTDEAEEASA